MDSINNYNLTSIEQITSQYLSKNQNVPINNTSTQLSFDEILKQKQELSTSNASELKFSKHASARLIERNINLSKKEYKRLENGTKKAEEKVINESLMLMDDMAFIVNIKNN